MAIKRDISGGTGNNEGTMNYGSYTYDDETGEVLTVEVIEVDPSRPIYMALTSEDGTTEIVRAPSEDGSQVVPVTGLHVDPATGQRLDFGTSSGTL